MSQAIKTLAPVTVGLTAAQVDQRGQNYHKWASVRVQSDGANTGTIYVGDNNVSATRYAAALSPGDFYVIGPGSAVDPTRVWVVASVANQIVHPSGT